MFRKFLSGIKYLILGHFVVLKHCFRKSVTLEYPEIKKDLNENFRGRIYLKTDENGEVLCRGCGLCQRVCPVKNVIQIEKNENNKVIDYKIDISKCIFCGNCQDICTFGAIKMSREYELATDNKAGLLLGIEDLKEHN